MTLKETFREVLIRQMEWRGDEILLNRILAELVAAVPTVTKEVLAKTIQRHLDYVYHEKRHYLCEEGWGELLTDLHALLTPTAAPTWCQHISRREDQWMQTAIDPSAKVIPVGSTWERCPICGAERPAEV